LVAAGDFQGRRAPYAPISALERFFERIRDRQTPDRVDHKFLRKLGVAHNNEYSLLSALKFLGILDEYGTPTTSYRSLQTTDQFKEALWSLVQRAYKPVFEAGANTWSTPELVDFFRVNSSASQAKNAARFFRAVCNLADHEAFPAVGSLPQAETRALRPDAGRQPPSHSVSREMLPAKAALLEKLPAAQPGWSADEYLQICDRFIEMLRHLDEPA
jgi:Family of unknown function (DUF5343)